MTTKPEKQSQNTDMRLWKISLKNLSKSGIVYYNITTLFKIRMDTPLWK